MTADPRPNLPALTNRDSGARSHARQNRAEAFGASGDAMLRTELHLRPCAWTQPTTSNRCLVRRDRSPPIRPGHSMPIATTAGGAV